MIARIQAWLATSGLILAAGVAVGIGGAMAWEHQTPFGLARKLDRAEARATTAVADLTTCRQDQAATVKETWRWKAAYDRLAEARQADAEEAAAAISARADEQARQCRAAYQSGVVAGRVLGERDHENDPTSPVPGGGPGAGGMRDDFAEAWRSGAVGSGSDR